MQECLHRDVKKDVDKIPTRPVSYTHLDVYKRQPEEEHRILYTTFKEGQIFLLNQLPAERTEYNISCDIHVLNGRKKLLVHQTATPILLGRDGMPLFSLCIMKHSVMHEIGNITVKRKGCLLYTSISGSQDSVCTGQGSQRRWCIGFRS